MRERGKGHDTALLRRRVDERTQNNLTDATFHELGCESKTRQTDFLALQCYARALERRLTTLHGGRNAIQGHAFRPTLGNLAVQQRHGDASLPGAGHCRSDPFIRRLRREDVRARGRERRAYAAQCGARSGGGLLALTLIH